MTRLMQILMALRNGLKIDPEFENMEKTHYTADSLKFEFKFSGKYYLIEIKELKGRIT